MLNTPKYFIMRMTIDAQNARWEALINKSRCTDKVDLKYWDEVLKMLDEQLLKLDHMLQELEIEYAEQENS